MTILNSNRKILNPHPPSREFFDSPWDTKLRGGDKGVRIDNRFPLPLNYNYSLFIRELPILINFRILWGGSDRRFELGAPYPPSFMTKGNNIYCITSERFYGVLDCAEAHERIHKSYVFSFYCVFKWSLFELMSLQIE